MTGLTLAAGLAAGSSNTQATPAPAMSAIRNMDYVIVFARNMPAMRKFYHEVMGFPIHRDVRATWVEYRVGGTLLTLTQRGLLFNDPPPPEGALSLQLAFRVAPGDVQPCAEALKAAGVAILSGPTDQAWGHRTLFFRDPDGNVVEIYADL